MAPRSMPGGLTRSLSVGLLLTLAVSSARGQRVSGVVLERDGATPASFVALLVIDSLGAPIARGQTTATGSFVIDLPRAGRYAVRALRVGFRPTTSPVVAVGTDTPAIVRMQLAGEPILLQTVRVRERSTCGLTTAGNGLIDAWDQARAALLGATQIEPSRASRFESVAWSVQRDVWPDSATRASVDAPRHARGDAFRSRPAHELLRTGFVQTAGDSVEFHAPDAFVLLDPEFAASYCFWLQPGPPTHSDWIGLGVGAAQAQRGKVTVEGVLWLMPNGALVRFDYRYVGLDQILEPADPGGRVEFLQLPTGQWIVARWSIRMPQSVVEMQQLGVTARQVPFKRLGRIIERGAFVSRVQFADRQFLDLGSDSLILTLRSSGAPQPMEGTVVRLPSEGQDWIADASGVVRLGPILPGNYRFLVESPLMRDVGLEPDTMDITLLPASARIGPILRLPSTTEVRRRLCPGVNNDAAAAGILTREQVVEFGSIYVSRASELADSSRRPTRWTVTEVDSIGRWRACGVQRGVTLALWGERAGGRMTLARFRIPRTVDLALVGSFSTTPFSVAASLPPPGREGVTLTVRVLAAKDSTPIRDAQAVLDDSLLARPNERGELRFPGQDVGAHTLTVRRLGLSPISRSLVLSETEPRVETVYLERLPQQLSEVMVRGRMVTIPSKYVDVLRRAASGWGTVFTREDIRGATDLKSLLAALPGMHISDREVRFGRCQDMLPSPQGKNTEPPTQRVQVYVDGVRVTMLPDLENNDNSRSGGTRDAVAGTLRLVHPNDIEFMEVYRGPAHIPAEFVNDACAVIAIWTRAY